MLVPPAWAYGEPQHPKGNSGSHTSQATSLCSCVTEQREALDQCGPILSPMPCPGHSILPPFLLTHMPICTHLSPTHISIP